MTSFSDLGLSPDLLNAVADAGYTTPTPIQAQAIPHVLAGRDVLGCAQTGTGKTASFTLPMIDILATGRARARMPRTLILEPTRELAAQVSQAFEIYGKHHKLSMALLIGGESFTDQERKLDRGVDVLIATPGRLMDLFDRGKILLSDAKILVIDEADRMLDMGFIPDIERIVSMLPRQRQTLFFSATMPPEIRRLADAFLDNPREISVAPPASPALTVTQALTVVFDAEKRRALRHLIRSEDVKNAIVFCNRKRDVDILLKSLVRHEFDAVSLHGDMAQSKRTETLEKFKAGAARILVASDVAARGLDVQGLSHVFNFDVPIHPEDYVHRIGRTGRAGNTGRAFTLATPEEGRAVAAIEKLIGKEIPRIEIPDFEHPALEEDDGTGRSRGRGSRKAPAKPTAKAPSKEAPRETEAASGGARRKSRSRGTKSNESPAGMEGIAAERPRADLSEPAAEQPDDSRPIDTRIERGRFEPVVMGVPPLRTPPPRGPARTPSRHRNDDEGDERVVGFGDHLPAFFRPRRTANSR